MSDSTPPVAKSLKPIVTLVAALTALVTACTSLVKATDKTVEQVSYETLSKKIVELQEGNAAMMKLIHEYDERTKAPVVPPPSFSSEPVASAFGPTAGHPLPPHVPAFLPPPSASAKRPPISQAAPPPWKVIRDHADRM